MAEAARRVTERSEWLALAGPAVILFAVDQATKALVAATLPVGAEISVIGDFFEIWHVQNRGAAFSLLQGETVLFVLVTLFAFGMIAYFHRTLRGQGLWLHVLLGVQLGGALGNLVDRLRNGFVTDFLSVGIGDLRWPTFNVADAAIVVGIGTLAGRRRSHRHRRCR